MTYFLGRDVVVAITTEDVAYGIDAAVNSGAKAIFTNNDGPSASTDINFAGPMLDGNAADSPVSGDSANSTIFGTQEATDGSGEDWSNEVKDLTGVDVGIGVPDEDITYMGAKSVLKAEIKKETTVSLTRKKNNGCWDRIFQEARYGVKSSTEVHDGLTSPDQSDFGYRVYIKLKDASEVLTIRGCCLTGHTVSLNADGTSEETMEFMSYLDPLIGAEDDLTVTTSGF